MQKATLQTLARDVRAIARSLGTTAKPLKPDLKALAGGRPVLAKNEEYVGVVYKNGAPEYHLIKLPQETDGVTFDEAVAHGKKHGDAPTRRDLMLMWISIPDKFKTDKPYWSSEQYACLSSYAWYQWFLNGGQSHWSKDNEVRACAVRRVPI